MKKCLIYLDMKYFKSTVGLLETANQMFPEDKIEVYGLVINQDYIEAKGYFDYLVHYNLDKSASYDPMIAADVIYDLHKKYIFDAILIPATQFGRMLAPRMSMRLHVGLVADVTEIHNQNNQTEMVRPAFTGTIMAGIINSGKSPIMLSVRPNVFSLKDFPGKDTAVIKFSLNKMRKSRLELLSNEDKKITYDICDCDVLVSGGGGTVKSFEKLKALADELNGQVSASRKVIDSGIAPRAIQVGQSGKTVTPKLYIALGINGAIQHVEGLRNVNHILSVNTNSNAPICALSDLVVEGEASIFIDKLLSKIKYNKEKKQ